MEAHIRIVTIAGSLRHGSLNAQLLAAARDAAPESVTMQHASLTGVPLFNEDREAFDGGGLDLAALRGAITEADAVLFSTPEYNQALPGVLKNAIDWLSRPPLRVLDGKAVAVIGATTGSGGTRYAQAELRHVLAATGSVVLGQPMLFVDRAREKFHDGTLVDATTQEQLDEVVAALADWTRRVSPRQFVYR